jgi:hypothetical protein
VGFEYYGGVAALCAELLRAMPHFGIVMTETALVNVIDDLAHRSHRAPPAARSPDERPLLIRIPLRPIESLEPFLAVLVSVPILWRISARKSKVVWVSVAQRVVARPENA